MSAAVLVSIRSSGRKRVSTVMLPPLLSLFAALVAGSCQQSTPAVSHRRLIEHQAMIDFSGLRPVEPIDNVKVNAAVPRQWDKLTAQSTPVYTHQQWRSPSAKTGVGVAYIHLPIPLNVTLLRWIARQEYSKKGNDGHVISEWTDELGRPWFEAENNKYRVRGYIVVNGFQAWVIYFGRKSQLAPDPAELSLAARAADSIVPMLPGNSKSK